MEKEFQFLEHAEKLKQQTRHCWYDTGRQESAAEHTWRLLLMVWRYSEKLDERINVLKCLKMGIVHDLPVSIAGDVPIMEDQNVLEEHDKKELKAMKEINKILSDVNAQEMFDLWEEYRKQESYESKYVKAIDKLETFLQHNQSPLTTWELKEKQMIFQDEYLKKYCEFDSFLSRFADEVVNMSIEKLRENGEDIETLRISAGEIESMKGPNEI